MTSPFLPLSPNSFPDPRDAPLGTLYLSHHPRTHAYPPAYPPHSPPSQRLVVPMLFGESANTVHVAAVEGSEHAAALTGGDVGLACLTWLVGVIIRAIVIGSHFPALQKLGYGMTKEDAMTCWWGGLHGGVGLALAMSMEHELREAGQPEQGARILLHVSVAAMLTLLVNAPTMAPMLKKFGLTSTSPAKQQKYAELRARVNAYAWAEFSKLIEQGKLAPQSKRWQDAVPTVIHVMTNEQRRASLTGHVNALDQSVLRSPPTEATQEIGKANDLERLYETRRAFLGLVRNAYTNYLEEGVIPARSTLAVHLIASIHYANDHIDEPLADWTELAKLALEIPAGTRYTLKVLKPLWGIKKLKIWLVENGPETYAENVAFALTAFIGAHENAQDQIKWMFGSKSDSLNAEQSLVCSESAQSIYKAKLFLHELHKVVVGEHLEAEDDVIDYVKARQISAVLLHRLAIFVEKLQKNGVLEDWMTEHLLHEVRLDARMTLDVILGMCRYTALRYACGLPCSSAKFASMLSPSSTPMLFLTPPSICMLRLSTTRSCCALTSRSLQPRRVSTRTRGSPRAWRKLTVCMSSTSRSWRRRGLTYAPAACSALHPISSSSPPLLHW